MQLASERLLRLAERQWGVIARWQFVDSGVGDATISRWTSARRLHRIYPGVYAVGHRAIPREGRLLAAVLYAGRGAALSHATAASWLGLISYLPDTTHVTGPRRRRSLSGVRMHRGGSVDRVIHRGLPVTPVARTLVDFASTASLDRVRKAVAEADFQRILDLDEIDAIARRGLNGSARLKQALSLHRPEYARTRSPLEDGFLDLCRRHRIRLPGVNVEVGGFTVDMLWRTERLIVELDGAAGHGTDAQRTRDRDRDLTLRRAGHSVLRYSWHQVTRQGPEVAADVRRALRERG